MDPVFIGSGGDSNIAVATPTNMAIPAGSFVVVLVRLSSATSATGATDSKGNIYTKRAESPLNGTVTSIWDSVIATALTATDTFTATSSGATSNSGLSFGAYTWVGTVVNFVSAVTKRLASVSSISTTGPAFTARSIAFTIMANNKSGPTLSGKGTTRPSSQQIGFADFVSSAETDFTDTWSTPTAGNVATIHAVYAVPQRPRLAKSAQGQITRSGVPWRTGGVNIFQLVLNDYPGGGNNPRIMSNSEIDSVLDKAVSLGCNFVRSHTLGISIGSTAAHLVAGISGTTSPVISYRQAAWDAMDYAFASAGSRGIYLMVPMTDQGSYFHGGKQNWINFRTPGGDPNLFYTDAQITLDFDTYISNWLNHLNPLTGLAYKDDPTLAVIEIGNEIYPAANYPSWSISRAQNIKAIAPNLLVADGTAADGQVMVPQHLASSAIDIHGTHPYSIFNSVTVMQQAIACEDAGKAYIVGEYPWSKDESPRIEAAARLRPNVFTTSFWSLQNDSDLHAGVPGNGGNPYGADDVSDYYPGKDSTQTTFNARYQDHANQLKTVPAPGTNRPAVNYSDTFDGSGAIDSTKFALALTGGASAARVSDVLAMKTGVKGGYGDKITVASQAPSKADWNFSFDVTPTDVREAYLRVWMRANSSEVAGGTLDFGGDAYKIEINSYGYWTLVSRIGGTETTLINNIQIPGFAAGVNVKFEGFLIGNALSFNIYTGSTRPAPYTVINSAKPSAGYIGVVMAGGSAGVNLQWNLDNWNVNFSIPKPSNSNFLLVV